MTPIKSTSLKVLSLLIFLIFIVSTGISQENGVQYSEKLEEEAKSGDPQALFELALCYSMGKGVDKNVQKTRELTRKSAEKGFSNAQVLMGHLAKDNKDYQEAFRWYKKAAEQGDANGQYELAYCYLNGKGIKQNDKKFLEWLNKSAKNGYSGAQLVVGEIFFTDEQYKKAAYWVKKAIENGNKKAKKYWKQKNLAQYENPGPPEKKDTGSFTDTRDGKTYKTVTIGNQTWMAENLAYKTDSGCWAYNNDQSNVEKYGYLYNEETAQNVCPEGWHLPSKEEFYTLTGQKYDINVGGEKEKEKTEKIAYKKLTEGGSSGFSVRLMGNETVFWTSDQSNINKKTDISFSSSNKKDTNWYWMLIFDKNKKKVKAQIVSGTGYSVRCIKDEGSVEK
jgi:uncharacterized protein (TIGR02145 family)